MRYILHCLLHGPVVPYQTGLIAAIADQFDLPWTQRQALRPHFTMKYWFETDHVSEIEGLLERFSKAHAAAPITVGGFGGFPPDVVFLNVTLSPPAQALFRALVHELRTISWMQWNEHDGDCLHFHATIAERCGEQYASIQHYLRGQEASFTSFFDNITILRQTSIVDGVDQWEVHSKYDLPPLKL